MNRPPLGKSNKAKDSKKTFALLKKRLGQYKKVVIFAFILSFTGALLRVIVPLRLGHILNIAQEAITSGEVINMSQINLIAIQLIIMNILAILLTYFADFIMTGVTQKISRDLRQDISKKINNLPLKYFDATPYGDILSRVTNDVDNISQNLNQALITIIGQTTTLIGIIVMMLLISVQLTLITFLSIPINLVVVIVIVKFSQKHFKAQQKNLGLLNAHIEEAFTGHTVVKAFTNEEENLKEFATYNSQLLEASWKSQFYSGLIMPASMFVGNLTLIAVAIVSGILAINGGNISLNFLLWTGPFIVTGPFLIGGAQSFIIYIRQFNQPIQQLAQISNVLQSCFAASERVFEFLEVEEMPLEENKQFLRKEDVKGHVEFKGVNFGYTSEKQIIFDFNCTVKPGQKAAIVGPTGAGKTTMVNLLMRFYEINSGSILIDGINIKDLTRENTASLFGMVLQDTWLFEGTILENLMFGAKGASFEEIQKACTACNIDHFIKSLPNGYDFMLDENASISQGQKQLLTIARAMIANTPMLILDEATSSVDTRTELLIQTAMDELAKNKTSFVIAHRLSTIKNADIILVMDKGNIIESGNHEELMKKNGFYTNLYNSQFQDQ